MIFASFSLSLDQHQSISGASGTIHEDVFVESSEFNTVDSGRTVTKLDVGKFVCVWPSKQINQTVEMETCYSSTLTLSNGAQQGCISSPHFSFTPFTQTAAYQPRFVDDATVVGLKLNGDEFGLQGGGLLRRTFALNTSETKELIIKFGRRREEPTASAQWEINDGGGNRTSWFTHVPRTSQAPRWRKAHTLTAEALLPEDTKAVQPVPVDAHVFAFVLLHCDCAHSCPHSRTLTEPDVCVGPKRWHNKWLISPW